MDVSQREQGRVDYLRLSITDRCNLALHVLHAGGGGEGARPRRDPQLRGARRLRARRRRLGITKVRITGGEPLVRLGCADFVGMLSRTSGIHDISLTTNGVLLPQFADELAAAGLERVNISLDSLDPERFARITRGGRLEDALAGLDAAFAAGFTPVKINTLLLPGIEEELDAFVELTREHDVHVRFIEFMPLDRRVAGDDLGGRGAAAAGRRPAAPAHGATTCCIGHDGPYGHGPAQYWKVARRARHHRLHRRRLRALLRDLQPSAPHRRRPAAHLPVLRRRDRRAAAARATRRSCAAPSRRPWPARRTTAAARRSPTTGRCPRSEGER